jgi:hypothetical protein
MTFRVSAKFQRHYGLKVEKTELPVQPFPQTWNLDLFRNGRSQLIVLASEEHSLFSFFIPLSCSKDFGPFLEAFKGRFATWMENIGLWDQPDTTEFNLGRRTNPRVIRSQCEFLFLTKCRLNDFEKPISPRNLEEVERYINSTPMSYLEMDSPDWVIWDLKSRGS